jgi:hypothetical protein
MQAYTPFYSPFTPQLAAIFIPLIFVIVLWTIAIKGYALWNAARGGQKKWFIVILIVNTLGILEIIYLIWYRPKNNIKEIAETPVTVSSSVQ